MATIRSVTNVLAVVLLLWGYVAKGGEIHDAAKAGDVARVKELLAANPDLIESKEKDGGTPLHMAAVAGSKEIVEFLIAKGANVNARSDLGVTPLHSATYKWSKQVAEVLLVKGADANAKSKDGYTPLHFAANGDIAKTLLDGGADANARANDRSTPLHLAAAGGRKDVVELLLVRGADANAVNGARMTPLDLARSKGRDQTAQLLESCVNYGATPLHIAAVDGKKEAVEALIAEGANVNARTKSGSTPLHLAAAEGRNDIAVLLLKKGADVNAVNSEGFTPIDLAREKGHPETAQVLRANLTPEQKQMRIKQIKATLALTNEKIGQNLAESKRTASVPLESLMGDLMNGGSQRSDNYNRQNQARAKEYEGLEWVKKTLESELASLGDETGKSLVEERQKRQNARYIADEFVEQLKRDGTVKSSEYVTSTPWYDGCFITYQWDYITKSGLRREGQYVIRLRKDNSGEWYVFDFNPAASRP